jgi:riboflavin kinase / FMN adenylyltransferase
MLTVVGTDSLQPEWPAATVCIGVFDGVHRGHQELIRRAVEDARRHERPAVVVTFDRHPASVLAPDRVPPSVATLDQNLEVFEALGASVGLVLPFDDRLAATTAQAFLDSVLVGRLRAVQLVVGHDFALGHGREGTHEWLARRVPTEVVAPIELDGARVSSTEVRSSIAHGDVAIAARLLGRPYVLEGVVVPGQRLGRTLGYPTVNLARPGRQSVPADGVYAGFAITRIGGFRAAVGVGTRPAVGGGPRTVEAHLLDYPGDDLYGTTVRLAFLRWLREERPFDGLDALRSQMAIDVEQARQEPVPELSVSGAR